jgi:transcriptional regulator with XRE-family HTH domain
VAGLRREEVAQLAGVSTDYYTRLEQGRHLSPSESVLDAIAGVLRLDATGRKHLADLVRATRARPRHTERQQVRPGLLRLMETLTTNRRSCWAGAPMCWPRTGWRGRSWRTFTRCRHGNVI